MIFKCLLNISRAYLYDDGLVRFASEQYNDNDSDLDNNLIHLTNFVVNRGNKESEREDRDGREGSVKWTVGSLREYMERRGEDWRNIWRAIEDLCVKTLLCGHYSMLTEYESSYGEPGASIYFYVFISFLLN